MRLFRTIFNLYIQSSIHVAFAVTSLAGVTLLKFDVPFKPIVLLFIFFGAVVGYNFVKYTKLANLHHLEMTPYIKSIRFFSAGCFFILIYIAFQLPFSVLTAGAGFGALTILYAYPFYAGKNLRTLKGTKIYVIALVWAGVTVILPLLTHHCLNIPDVILEFIQRFLFVIALTLPFEIRDLKFDEPELNTIPQLLGIKITRWLGAGLLFLVLILSPFKTAIQMDDLAVMALITAITAGSVFYAKKEQSEHYASFWVEGIPILWFILLWILKC
jgi:hypothetical protein